MKIDDLMKMLAEVSGSDDSNEDNDDEEGFHLDAETAAKVFKALPEHLTVPQLCSLIASIIKNYAMDEHVLEIGYMVAAGVRGQLGMNVSRITVDKDGEVVAVRDLDDDENGGVH